ncbi:MAG: aldo/keto reductase, partial [Lactobacillus johnsonii]|nr:aldo/keto reductase [Lactobacillus johnsonii]
NGNILSIPKAGNVKHIKENIAATDIKLTPDEIKLIDNDFPQPTEKKPLAMI